MEKEKANNLLHHIGNTPLLRLGRSLAGSVPPEIEIYVKAEWFNPGGSVKDRPAYKMIHDAMTAGSFRSGQALIDSTSGNTGIAYAMIGAAMGFKVMLAMPRNVSLERKKIVEAYGAEIIYSDPLKGSDGAREMVQDIVSENPQKYFFPDQYSNPSNWRAHYESTGPEIWRQTNGRITHFIAGMGTSGTVMGVSRFLKEKNREVKTIAVQPESFHGIEGLKNMDSSVPVKIYDSSVHDSKLTIPTEPAYEWTRRLAFCEGLLVGPSSGAALYGAVSALAGLKQAVAVVIFPDGGDKYLSAHFWDS